MPRTGLELSGVTYWEEGYGLECSGRGTRKQSAKQNQQAARLNLAKDEAAGQSGQRTTQTVLS